jgi:hypothetical protein
MARSLKDSEYLYGFHDSGGEQIMLDQGVPGWVLVTVGIGCDPNDRSGGNFAALSDRGLGVMVRLNNGYEPAGTIPHSSAYEQFAKRCANYVQNSVCCRIWIIGNEPNHPVERPSGQVITPQMYARCYRLCRDEIHKVDPGAQVLVAAVAPWCAETKYPGNSNGDWVQYFKEILTLLSPDKCDGFTLHTYTHGDNPDLIASPEKMGSFLNYHFNFLAYRDFLNVVPPALRSLPCYITETDQGDVGGKRFPWTDRNAGWVQRAYGEIDWWNRQPGNQIIRALILYRWSKDDEWYIVGKPGVIEDFKRALSFRYRWEGIVPDPIAELRKRLETLEAQLGKLQPTIQQIARLSATLAELQKIIDDLVKNAPSTAPLTGQLDDLDKAIAQLEKDLTGGTMPSQVPQPQLQDVRTTLPKHPTRQYPTRPESAVRRIIVHHTATRADITPQRLAEAQVAQDRAGITYHFLVGGDGTLYWTQPFETAVEQALVPQVNADGVAVALAGNFTSTVPSEAQMAGAASLIAWLLSKFGLTTEAVFGRREVETRVIASPGARWPEYKPPLLEAAQEIIDRYPPVVDKDALIAQLRQQVQELQAQVAQLQQRNKSLADTVGQQQAEIVRLNAEIVRLNAEIVRLQTIIDNFGGGVVVPKPAIIDVVDSLEKHPTLPPYPKRTKPISMIVIHHADTPKNYTVQRLAHYHVFGKRWKDGVLVKDEWPGIGYHYVVAPDGKIYQGQRDETKSNQAGGEPNNYSIAISLIGRFMKKDYSGNLQAPEDQVPTPEQLRSASHLAAWLMQQYKVPIEKVVGHTDVWAAYPEYFTWCPGDQWKAGAQWRNTLRQQIQDWLAGKQNVVSRQIEHYLLFWDHGGSEWAKADWQNAQAYIAHFRPTTGFSVEDALQARHVTIVGGDAGVSGKDEARLRAAGIGVYRLAGVNEADTRAKLDELIRNDTPWPGAPAPVRAVGEPIVSLAEVPEIIETPVPDEWTVPDDWTIGL